MRAGIVVLAAAALAACAPEAEVSGRADFLGLCASCHGADATGTGEAPDLTRIAARNGGVFDYAAVMSQIDGYTRTNAGETMPGFGALLEGEMVRVDLGDGRLTPTPVRLLGIAEYLESIQVADAPS